LMSSPGNNYLGAIPLMFSNKTLALDFAAIAF